MFKVLRNGLLGYILHTCPNLWCNSCSKCYGMGAPLLWSWSIVVNGNGGLKMPRALTCARSQQKCSEARLDKKCDENAADTTAKRKTPQKTNPIFRAQKIWTCYNSMQITMFYWRFFSAHCNCADFWEFFQIAMLQNHKNFHVFQLFTKDVFLINSCTYTRGKQSAGMFLMCN